MSLKGIEMLKRILFSMLPLILLLSFSAIAQQNRTLVLAGQAKYQLSR